MIPCLTLSLSLSLSLSLTILCSVAIPRRPPLPLSWFYLLLFLSLFCSFAHYLVPPSLLRTNPRPLRRFPLASLSLPRSPLIDAFAQRSRSTSSDPPPRARSFVPLCPVESRDIWNALIEDAIDEDENIPPLVTTARISRFFGERGMRRYVESLRSLQSVQEQISLQGVVVPVYPVAPTDVAILMEQCTKHGPLIQKQLAFLDRWQHMYVEGNRGRSDVLRLVKGQLRSFSRGMSPDAHDKALAAYFRTFGECGLGVQLRKRIEQIHSNLKNEVKGRRKRRKRKGRETRLLRKMLMREEEKAARKMQSLWRAKKAREQTRVKVKDVYEKVYDKEKGRYYYFNSKTNHSTWKKVGQRVYTVAPRGLRFVQYPCTYSNTIVA